MMSWEELILPDTTAKAGTNNHASGPASGAWDILEELDLGVAVLQPDGTLLHCNRAFARLLGVASDACTPGAALRQMLLAACPQHPDSPHTPAWVDSILTAHHNGGQAEWRSPDGQWWHARFAVLSHDGLRLCQVANVSHEKRLEQEIRHLAESPDRDTPLARGLAQMGHELRTPLNAILGFSDLIRSEAIGPLGNPSYADYANDIHDSGQILLTAVDRIAMLVKLESGLVRPQSVAVSAQVLVAMAMETVQPTAAAAGVTLRDHTRENDTVLFLDRFLISSALAYLAENAIAATPVAGAVEFHCRSADAGGLLFEVRDFGRGIPPDALAAIREPFVRYETTNGRAQTGVGMGLPVADRMAALMGCSIELDSRPDAGTTARLHVPPDRIMQA